MSRSAGARLLRPHGRGTTPACSGRLPTAEVIDASLESMPIGDQDEHPLPMRLIPLDTVPADHEICIDLTDHVALEHSLGPPAAAWSGRALQRIRARLQEGQADCERAAEALEQLP